MVRNEYLNNIRDIDSKGGQNVGVDYNGKVYMWPLQKEKNLIICRPVEVPLEEPIVQVACGLDFTILLTKAG